MANFIEETNILPTRFVTPTSRYAGSKVLYYSDLNKITFNTYKRITRTINPQDRYTLITPGLEYRPDLVSFFEYGVVDFWWLLLEVNGMKDILDFKAGATIRLPGKVF